MHLLSDFSTNNKNTAGDVSKIAADDTSHRLHRGKPQHFDKHDGHTHDYLTNTTDTLMTALSAKT